jgi:hypothetical protein
VIFRFTGSPGAARYVQEFIQDQLFGAAPVTVDTQRRRYADLADLRDPAEGVSLDVVSLHRNNIAQLAGAEAVVLPLRVHMELDVTGSWEQVQARLSRQQVKRGARWRSDPRHTVRMSHDRDEYFWFYEAMVAPSMAQIYGSRNRMLSAGDGYQQVFEKGGMFMIEVDGAPVAGGVTEIDYESRRITGRIIGVKDGDQSYRANGAQNAVYHAMIEWAWNNNFAVVDFGNSESFLSKGTFRYKMRFGTEVALPPGGHADFRTWLRWNPRPGPVADFLIDNPVVLADGRSGRLGAGYFHSRDRPPRRDISYPAATGLAFERLISLD